MFVASMLTVPALTVCQLGHFCGQFFRYPTLLLYSTALHNVLCSCTSLPIMTYRTQLLLFSPLLLSFDLLCSSLFFYSTLTLIPPLSNAKPGILIPPLSNARHSPHDLALLLLNAILTLLCSVVTLHYRTPSLIYSTQLPRQKIIVRVGVCTRRLPCGCSSMMAR